MLAAVGQVGAQDYLLVHTKDSILKYEVSPEATVEFKNDFKTTKFDDKHSIYVVEGGKEQFKKTEFINEPTNDTDDNIRKHLDNYAVDMLIDYSQNKDNLLVSPLSASTLYSMVSNFTDTVTLKLYLKNMGLEKFTVKEVNSCCVKLNEKLRKVTEISNENYINRPGRFVVENSMWLRQNDTIYNSFLDVADAYNVTVKGIDFSTGAGVLEATQNIRDMMKDETFNLERNSWDNVSSIVTSAMDFQYSWGPSVGSENGKVTFDNADGTETQCYMISSSESMPFAMFDNFDMLEMPYNSNGNENFSTYFVLPREFSSLEQALADIQEMGMDQCISKLKIHKDRYKELKEMDILIPKFKCEGVFGLNSQKESVSYDIRQLYLSNLPDVSPNGFSLDDIYQAYSIQLDEHGTSVKTQTVDVVPWKPEWAASGEPTGEQEIELEERFPDIIEFYAVRPFAVFIKDKDLNFIAYACCINNMKNALP